MTVTDNNDQEVLIIKRPYRCDECCFFCCLMSVDISTPTGTSLGGVKQTCSVIKPKFDIRNAEDDTVLKLRGPCIKCRCCGDVEFDLYDKDLETVIGRVAKQWSGLGKEWFTDADQFGITFPMDLDVRMKAVMIGAVFLLDFMFYEKPRND
ncbi:phospholipid scramblase 1-like [Saccoglossus kowalevskii]|uniref:Phospholipid scramblase n=1 Tax=Saccoglossus kowalevskii TaxID=10224 RepID=A0ABM0GP87_SACKO|nr:PREDICTED: phospholipid scramblase 1-like [Saccoglossus kowalevskii]